MAGGGARTPANPAMVSGPGALSQRTDGGPSQPNMMLPDAAYGEQQDFQEIQGGAPMAADPSMMGADPRMAGPSGPPPTGLMNPTQRPDEPLTEGVPVGPGGNSIQGLPNAMQEDTQMLVKYLPAMRSMAAREGTPRSFQLFVKYLEANQ